MRKFKGSYISYQMMYMYYYLSMALYGALISVYLMDRGYSASQVSIVSAVSFVVSMLFQPLIGILSDRYNKKVVNSIVLSLSAVSGILFIFMSQYLLLTIVFAIGYACMNAANPVIEAMAVHSKYKYGSVRIWGTIGYAVGSRLAGLIYEYINPSAMYVFSFIAMVLCIIGLSGSEDVKYNETKEPVNGNIFKNGQYIYYLLILILFYGSTGVNSLYLPAMYQSMGMSVDTITIILFVCTMMELLVILVFGKYMNRIPNKVLLILAFSILMIQFGIYSFVPVLWVKMAATIFTKSVTTMAFIMINLKVISSIVPQNMQNTALAVAASVQSLASIVFQILGGKIIDLYSYHTFYFLLMIAAAAGLVLSVFYKVNSGNDLNLF